MENGSQFASARSLRLVRFGLMVTLICILLIPGLLASQHQVLKAQQPDDPTKVLKPRQRILVKIYAILRSNWPDMKESTVWNISDAIHRESTRYRLDPILILALIDVESKFQHAAVSPAGARGLMQILPGTAKALVDEIGLAANSHSEGFRPEFLDDPIVNIKLGVYYLQNLKKIFQSLNKALIAYNLGPTELQNRLNKNIVYPGAYAASVLDVYQKYKESQFPTF